MPTPVFFDTLLPDLLGLVSRAGECVRRLYDAELEPMEKQDGSMVTEADHQSHKILKEGLQTLCPAYSIVSEEDPSSWSQHTDLYWLIDPLDGTTGFIEKNGEFCVNVAFMDKNRPIFGLIHAPLTGQTFYGYGGMAWVYENGQKIPLHTRPVPQDGMTLLLGGYGKKFKAQEDFFLKAYPITHVTRLRSALKFTALASGKADIYLRFEDCFEWDTAAGQALVEAAGGIMATLSGEPFLYGKPNFLNKEFVVLAQKHDSIPNT